MIVWRLSADRHYKRLKQRFDQVPQAISTEAIILRRVNYGEADRVVTFITAAHGQVSGYAKGVRKQKSKLAGGLELCMLSEISYLPSKRADGLATITSTRMKEFYDEVVKDYDVLQDVFSLLKIVDKASEFEESPLLFTLSIELLRGLNANPASTAVELWFLIRLSSLLGQGFQLQSPLNAEKFSNEAMYQFDFEQMGFLESDNGNVLPKDIKLLKVMSVAETPKNLGNIVGIDESLNRVEHVLKYLKQQLEQL